MTTAAAPARRWGGTLGRLPVVANEIVQVTTTAAITRATKVPTSAPGRRREAASELIGAASRSRRLPRTGGAARTARPGSSPRRPLPAVPGGEAGLGRRGLPPPSRESPPPGSGGDR